MTNEEAINVLDFERSMCRFNPMTGEDRPMDRECAQLADACDVAIKALEKQIPKKPDSVDEDYGVFQCPRCKTAIYGTNELSEHKYCLNCGQAIDWSDEE